MSHAVLGTNKSCVFVNDTVAVSPGVCVAVVTFYDCEAPTLRITGIGYREDISKTVLCTHIGRVRLRAVAVSPGVCVAVVTFYDCEAPALCITGIGYREDISKTVLCTHIGRVRLGAVAVAPWVDTLA